MRFNFTFLAQFIGGLYGLYVASEIFKAGMSGGFLYEAIGAEARIRGALLVGVSVYLISLPLLKERSVKWLDIIFMGALIISTEFVAHAIALTFKWPPF